MALVVAAVTALIGFALLAVAAAWLLSWPWLLVGFGAGFVVVGLLGIRVDDR